MFVDKWSNSFNDQTGFGVLNYKKYILIVSWAYFAEMF